MSSAEKTPIIPVCRASKKMKYAFARLVIDHDARTASGIRKVVNMTSHRLTPSIPVL